MQAFLDNLSLAFGTFAAHPLRSLLTLLGIVIGVATVVTMMALIEGLRVKVNRDLSQLGANVFRVDKWPAGIQIGKRDWQKISRRPNLTLADRKAIVDHCPSATTASASAANHAQRVSTSSAETQPNVFVVGVTPEYSETAGITIASGRFLGEAEDVDARPVAVLGPDVADRLFPGANPLGQEVRVRNRPFAVVGVLERRGKILGLFNLDNMVMLPMQSFLSLYGKKRSVSINVQAVDADSLEKAQEEVRRLMRRRREVPALEEDDFEIATNESMTKTLNELSQVITAATFGVCVLSLLVGGIGILNIMLVAVAERTREIGIRKALGARKRRVLAQFTTEAVVLSLVGGAIGIALGFGLAFLGRWTLGLYTAVPAWAVALSLAMSSGVGLLFGIYPAARAARLDPVEAMRAE
ncbi:MAG: ABC transporter permease [Myxococcales bacterium]|nr:ABC transporter permease [Myxococcales bacterium]